MVIIISYMHQHRVKNIATTTKKIKETQHTTLENSYEQQF